jgi:WhiB family redox-sensing transcriptional regulator
MEDNYHEVCETPPIQLERFWRERAACRNMDPNLFFPNSGRKLDNEKQEAIAKAVCARCVVRTSCLEYALRTDQIIGVWGGMSEEERRNYAIRRSTEQ